jgi:hypothetical protein
METLIKKVSVANVEDFITMVNAMANIGLFSCDVEKQPLHRDDIAEWLQQFVQISNLHKYSFSSNSSKQNCCLGTDLHQPYDFTKLYMEYGYSDFDDLRMK